MVKDGAEVPIKAAPAPKKDAAKAKCEGLRNTHWHSPECFSFSDLQLQHAAQHPANRVASLPTFNKESSQPSGHPVQPGRYAL